LNANIKSRIFGFLSASGIVWFATVFIHTFLQNSRLIIVPAVFLTFVFLFNLINPVAFSKTLHFLYKNRWGIALVVFLICVFLKLSGSSISVYNNSFVTKSVPEWSTLFGVARPIRSDEYGVQTMKFFSQSFNNYGLFSNRMSLSDTNMVIDYYSPVLDITAIGKPLMWGYLLLGSEIGLSFYWCGMEILLFMLGFETLKIITNKRVFESAAGSFMIALSPAIQWWFMPHMPIVVLYAMALFCVGYHFFTVQKEWQRWALVLLAVISIYGFVLSIFPSYQVTFLYATIILLIVSLIRDKDLITFKAKKWYYIFIICIVTGALLFYFLYTSVDALKAVMNTAYPGKRISTGGDLTFKALFADLSSLILPYKDITYSNNCEVSSYIHFSVLFVLLFPRMYLYLRKNRSRDRFVGLALFAIVLLVAEFMVIGIPEFLAKITFLSYCNRPLGIYGFVSVLFTIWGFSQIIKHKDILKIWEKILYPAVYILLNFLAVDEDLTNYLSFSIGTVTFKKASVLILLLALSVVIIMAFIRNKKAFLYVVVAVMVVAGGTVNPIERGAGAVTNHPLSEKITEISEKDDSYWLCIDTTHPISYFAVSNFALANGAKVLSATNFYPDFDKLEIIDPLDEYINTSNRYSNQAFAISDEKNKIEEIAPDNILFTVNPETVKKLTVKYLLSDNDYTELLEKYDIDCSKIFEQDGYCIYKLSY